MATIIAGPGFQAVTIPEWVTDFASFRRWATSDESPDTGRCSFLEGNLWVDVQPERVLDNLLRTEITSTLADLADADDRGAYLAGMLLSNIATGMSTQPDGMFISHGSLAAGRVKAEHGMNSAEVVGTPDLVVEAVTPHWRPKDRIVLRDLYHRAGIPEYWMFEPSGDDPASFQILVWKPAGYTSAPRADGWVHSPVFGKKFRLTTTTNRSNLPVFNLEVQD